VIVKRTKDGGMLICGDTPLCAFRVETDADGNYPAGRIEIRTPKPDLPKQKIEADFDPKSVKRGGCCDLPIE